MEFEFEYGFVYLQARNRGLIKIVIIESSCEPIETLERKSIWKIGHQIEI